MKKLLLLPLTFGFLHLSAQKNKTDKEKLTMDSTAFLNSMGRSACECIDSVYKAMKQGDNKNEAFAECIDAKVTAYQLSLKMMDALKSDGKEFTINLNVDKNSREYKRYYYEIERWLKDSCDALNKYIANNDIVTEKSFSRNAEALDAYQKGIDLIKKDAFSDAIPFFAKAVKLDPEFIFAWDNLALSYRKTNNLSKAEEAYKRSLKIDPAGRMALQNIALVYLMQKKDDEAIDAYKAILTYYSDDPEAYYGVSMVYMQNKKDYENALNYMCKAYNLYVKQKSAYRSDAEKAINLIYSELKAAGKLDTFNRILKENNISPN